MTGAAEKGDGVTEEAKDLSRLRLGTAPDSWGVWFPSHPNQVPWNQFLDEAAAAGYKWIELGPYGYLPTDPAQLREELAGRDLRLSGGTVITGLQRGQEGLRQALDDCRASARLVAALGARHLVVIPEPYRAEDGTLTWSRDLTPDEWADFMRGLSTLSRSIAEEFDVRCRFHPHADTHVATGEAVERLLHDTPEETVSLCLDTGHVAYCGGDNAKLVQSYPSRIGYVHLKAVDPAVRRRVQEEDLPFAKAVALGVMVEPPHGEPAMPGLLSQLEGLGVDLFTIVEQDMFPCRPDAPLPIAMRTRRFLGSCGLGPVD